MDKITPQENKSQEDLDGLRPAEAAPDLNAITFRCARSITERILRLAFKHTDQHWLDAQGTDAEKLSKIVGEARDLLELLDTAVPAGKAVAA